MPIKEKLSFYMRELDDNQLQGPIPATFGKLINLKKLRIDGNPISGKISSFVGNWTQLQRLDMLGTSSESPFAPFSQP